MRGLDAYLTEGGDKTPKDGGRRGGEGIEKIPDRVVTHGHQFAFSL